MYVKKNTRHDTGVKNSALAALARRPFILVVESEKSSAKST
jgi:hypothetical protein